nr:GNAT family N-acetyltransferase [uncultured Lacibacter sp.]
MINTVSIQPVSCKKDLNLFIQFPYGLNKNNRNWVPPLLLSQKELLNEKHLFWQRNPHRFFLAFKEGRCVGRIAAFINREHNAYHQTKECCFGFLEAENDSTIFSQLFSAAEAFAQEQHCTKITGPLNPSLHYELGVLVAGFTTVPYFMLTYNYDYYDEQIKKCGYSGLKDFYSYKLERSQYLPTEKMKRVSHFLHQKYKVHIRQADIQHFKEELDIFHSLYNDAFVSHWGFTPMGKEEFFLLAKDLKAIIDPRMILVAEVNDEPVAFLLCVPNLNEILHKIKNGRLFPWGIFKLLQGRKKITSIRVITAAVKCTHKHLGLGALLYPEIMKRGAELNYQEGELSWVAEDNTMMNRIATDLGAVAYKTYRLYHKNF